MDPRNDSSSSTDEEDVPIEEELEDIFAEMHEILSEIEKEKEEKELEAWLAEWKVLTDAGEAWLMGLGYTHEIVYTECFEEIMSGDEVDPDVEIAQLTDEDEDDDEDDEGGGGGGYGGGGGGGSGWGGSGGGTTGG